MADYFQSGFTPFRVFEFAGFGTPAIVMDLKKIEMQTSIYDLSDDLKGHSVVRFIDWTPDVYLSYSVDDKQSRPIRKGQVVFISHRFLIYKYSKAPITLDLGLL